MRSDMARAVIMAGGEGARLRPFTYAIPKPLLPIGRKPVAQIIIERLRDHGFTDIIMTLEYGADLIRAYFQDGSQFGVNIGYYQEPRKMGTAGCIAHIPSLRQSAALVTNGDILTRLDYREMARAHGQSGAALTVAARTHQAHIPYGVLSIDGGRVTSIDEKPRIDYHINAGVYILSPEALEFIPRDTPSDMTGLINKLAQAGREVAAFPFDGAWCDLATADDFEKAQSEAALILNSET